MIEVESGTEFQKEVIEEKGPVVVQFHANWCGPCKALAPRFSAASTRGRGKWVRADVDKLDAEILSDYNIQSVPTLIKFVDGQAVQNILGRTADDMIREAELD